MEVEGTAMKQMIWTYHKKGSECWQNFPSINLELCPRPTQKSPKAFPQKRQKWCQKQIWHDWIACPPKKRYDWTPQTYHPNTVHLRKHSPERLFRFKVCQQKDVNSVHLDENDENHQWDFEGPPIIGPPHGKLAILFPYHSHKNP